MKPLDDAPLEPLLQGLPGPALDNTSLLHQLPEGDAANVLAPSVVQDELNNRLRKIL